MKTDSKKRIKGISLVAIALAMGFSFSSCILPGTNSSSEPLDSSSSSPVQPDDPVKPDDPVTPVEKYKESLLGKIAGTTVWEDANSKFYTDYNSIDELREAASDLNEKLAEEGMVLMKNADNALPLSANETKISMLGYRSYNILYGGGGSGAGVQGVTAPVQTLITSMNDAGFSLNQKLLSFYTGAKAETHPDDFPASVLSSYASYHDAAILTFTRSGSEGSDIKMHNVAGNEDENKHNLELTDAEIALVKHAKANFKKVIVLINSANCMELGELNAKKTDDNLGVDAILWMGQPGNDGAAAVGRILNGTVNPSGHTVDTWERDFTKGPTYTNIGAMSQNYNEDGTRMNNNLYVDGQIAKGKNNETYHSVEYREGIYMGYKYYETAYDIADAANKEAAYSNVVYPFGYGLSYTSFDWEMTEDIAEEAEISAANSTVTLKVKVTNTGKVAGKDVVQVYANPPYTKGGIEKATANLMGFAKTKLLQPGESEVVTVQFAAQDMASFDWNDANENNFKGYELEAGDYVISARNDSHTVAFDVVRTVKETIKCTTDYATGNEITPQFTGEEGLERYKTTNDAIEANLISRTDLKQPVASTIEDRTVDAAYIQMLNSEREYFSYQDTEKDAWYVSAVPAGWNQAQGVLGEDGKYDITINDMIGKTYSEPTIVNGVATAATDEGTKAWDAFMNQLTWEEMVYLVCAGDYGQNIPLPSIDKEMVFGGDGPTQFAWNSSLFFGSQGIDRVETIGTNWVVAPVTAATWNVELAAEQGRMIGNESLFANIGEWYGPGLNIHRSPFSGRNFEYYSEDGVLSGLMCAQVMKGVTSKGVMSRMKHMFLNDQETNRNTSGGVLTWCTEQAIREIYLKPFELCVKYGNATGGMTAFNRIGDAVCSTNYALLENIFRGEWNFKGTFVTDCQDYPEYRYLNLMCRTGQELPLGLTINKYQGEKIYGGRFGIGYASAVEGTWSAADKCVKVAPNYETAVECENIRMDTGDMYLIYHDEATVAALAAKETVLSPTHYYAVRKSAQRVLYNYLNNNSIENGLNDTLAAQECSLKVNNSKASYQIQFNAEEIGTSEIVVTGAKGLPEGLTISATGKVSGKATTVGTYQVTVNVVLDGWVKTTLKLTVNVVE